ncbi:MAG: CNNM domain-containing protein [Planctomycetota bacterium]
MTPEAEIALWLVLAGVGLAGSALCSGIETSTYAVDRVRLRVRAEAGEPAARRLLLELKRPDRALTALLLGNNAANYAGTLGVTSALALTGMSEAQGAVVATLIITPTLVIFAEALPKELFRVGADRIGVRLSWVIRGLRLLGTAIGVVPMLTALGRVTTGKRGGDAMSRGGRAGLAALLREGVEASGVAPTGLIDRAMDMSGRTAADQMVPWDSVAALRGSWTLERARTFIAKRPHGAYPVLDVRGKLLGLVTAAQVLTADGVNAGDLAEAPVDVGQDASLRRIAMELSAAGARTAVVRDEDGHPVGLVSFTDLVTPLLGRLA